MPRPWRRVVLNVSGEPARGADDRSGFERGVTKMNRRDFLSRSCSLAAASLCSGRALGQLIAPPATDKKVAALVTTYHRYSHADNIVTRFMEGYSIVGKS